MQNLELTGRSSVIGVYTVGQSSFASARVRWAERRLQAT